MQKFTIQCDRERDGRWLAKVEGLPNVLAYGSTPEEAMNKAEVQIVSAMAGRADGVSLFGWSTERKVGPNQ
jgi:hypothetical protein